MYFRLTRTSAVLAMAVIAAALWLMTRPVPVSYTASGISFATYVGGKQHDTIRDLVFDSAGNIVVSGYSQSVPADLPMAKLIGSCTGGQHAMVAKFSPTGALIWITLIGGSGSDGAYGIAIDSSDNIYLAGLAGSQDFPTTAGAFSRTHSGGTSSLHGKTDTFALKLSPDGQQLVFSTYLGGSHNETARGGLDIDSAGNMYVVGNTESPDFLGSNAPKVNSFAGGASDGFIVKLASDGAKVIYCRFIGGSNNPPDIAENVVRVRVDAQGQAYLAASVGGTDLPTTAGAFSRTLKGGSDVYVAKLASDGKLLFGTYIGGSAYEYQEHALTIDAAGNTYIAGYTASKDFPTLNAVQPNYGGGAADLYLAKIGPAGQLVFATYIGGSGDDGTTGGPTLDAAGNIYVFGSTGSSNFTVTPNALQPRLNGVSDAFLRIYSPSGQQLLYSTFLGGSGLERGNAVRLDPAGNVYVVGETASPDFPVTPGAFLKSWGGNGANDAYLAKLDPPIAPAASQPPVINPNGVVNAGSYTPEISPGGWASIFGTNLAPIPAPGRIWRSSEIVNGMLPTVLENVSVKVDGKQAAVYFVSPDQLNIQVPDDSMVGLVNVEVTTPGGTALAAVPMKGMTPSLFTLRDPSGRVYAAAVHTDGAVVGPATLAQGARPAKPGEFIQIYGTGFGPTSPVRPAGQLITAAPLANPFRVRIGSVVVSAPFGGVVGAGLYQFNASVPDVPDGDYPVLVDINNQQTQSSPLVAIQH